MFAALVSIAQVRLSSSTNAQGMPSDRLSILTSPSSAIQSEMAQAHGLGSPPFAQGIFETRCLSLLAAIDLQVIGGVPPLRVLEPG